MLGICPAERSCAELQILAVAVVEAMGEAGARPAVELRARNYPDAGLPEVAEGGTDSVTGHLLGEGLRDPGILLPYTIGCLADAVESVDPGESVGCWRAERATACALTRISHK